MKFKNHIKEDKPIIIQKSPTADSRTRDFSQVSKEQLLASTKQHMDDVKKGIEFLKSMLDEAAENHDHDKLTGIERFYANFITGFKEKDWWDNHKKVNRHHLADIEGIPEGVNLIDVLEMIIDCVMAGMARNGEVYDIKIKDEVLKKAFDNTIDMLKNKIRVEK